MQIQEQEPNDRGVRPVRVVVVRNTYPDLVSTTIRDWAAMTGEIAPIKMGHPPSQHLQFRLPDGSTVHCDMLFIALDRPEHVRKLRGLQATIAWLNEAKELPYAIVEMIDARLGRYPSRALAGVDCTGGGAIIGDTNAPDDDHWYANMERKPPDGWRFFVQPGAVERIPGGWKVNENADNIDNLPEKYYERLLNGKRPEWIKVNLANLFGTSVDGRPVIDEFSPEMHVREFEVDPDSPVLAGADWGLTPALVLGQQVNGQLRIFDEIITENMSAVQAADLLEARLSSNWPMLHYGHGWGDPGGGRSQVDKRTPFDIFNARNFPLYPTDTNQLMARRDAVGHRLTKLVRGAPSLVVHPRCKVLKTGLAGHYQFRRILKLGDDLFHDVPDKNMYSHVCEALQYLCLGVGALTAIAAPESAGRLNIRRKDRHKSPRKEFR